MMKVEQEHGMKLKTGAEIGFSAPVLLHKYLVCVLQIRS